MADSLQSWRIEGVATALSSIAHGGEHAGTVGYFRREKIVLADGSVEQVPVISGNAVRGVLRDHAAGLFWRALGEPELPLAVFHLLWSGGSLAKAGAGHVLGARQLQQVRQTVPVVSLFGGSGAGRIIEGKLQIGKMVPVCAETAHLMPLGVEAGGSVWEMLQIEEFTRRDDSKRDQLHDAIDGFRPKELAAADGALLAVEAHAPAVDERDGPAQQMRYGVETIAAGARFHWWMSLHAVTTVERALFAGAVESWLASGGAVGGRSSSGHGRLRLDVHQWQHQTPVCTVGEALAVPGGDPLAEHVAAHRGAIDEALGWFT